MKLKSLKSFLTVALLGGAATLTAWGLAQLKSLADLEAATYDIRQIAFPPTTKAADDIVMVWLDEATMAGLPYRSPIPRDFLATLTQKISAAGPKLIGFDIFFADPSFADADNAFAESLKMARTFAVVPRRATGEVDLPLTLFRDQLTGLGLADLPFNPFDATVRNAQLTFATNEAKWFSFAGALYQAITGREPLTAVAEQHQHLGPLQLTPFANDVGAISIRFAGPPSVPGSSNNVFKIYSAKLVAQGLIPAAWLKDKIVLVGAGYKDLKDAFLTPYYSQLTNFAQMNGVEIHANILSSLLTQQFYFHFTPWQQWMLIALCALIVAGVAAHSALWKSLAVYLLIVIGETVLSVVAFRSHAVIVPTVLPFVGATISLGLGTGWRALTEGKQKRWIKGVFAHYVPPQLVDRLSENPALLKLGGEERIVTSFFSDIASFTSISEKLNPTTLVKFLNEYLGRMNEILFRHGATLDKYEGDAIIAFFNAPLDVAQHELGAVRSALELDQACRELTVSWRETIGRDIVTRVGLNTGPAVVGNMGSEARFDYTAISDTINLASRLEGTNKFYGTRVMCSEFTAKGLSDEVVIRPVDRVRVKGKSEPILIYEVAGFSATIPAETITRLIEPYTRAFACFEKRDLDGARHLIEKIVGAFPSDGPTTELGKRIQRAVAEPTWDLVTELQSK